MIPFFEVIASGNRTRLQELIDADPYVVHSVMHRGEHPDYTEGSTGLHLTVALNDVEIAELLVKAGVDLEARNRYGRTPLHDSIEYGRPELQKLFMACGADIDVCTAAILGKVERLKELLAQQPGLVEDRSTHLSPLGWASFGNQVETAKELLSCGARPQAEELLCAASVGHAEVGQLLLEHGADPNKLGEEFGGNALHAAACMRYTSDSTSFVTMLLENGANPSIVSGSGKTALEMAEESERKQSLKGNEKELQEVPKNFKGVVNILRAAEAR